MNNDISHLTTGAAALLSETDERRIRAIRSRRWVLYPRAKQALDRLSRLLDHPRGTRMPSVAIYGDSGMGKTMIMKRFRDEHPPSFNPVTGALKTPVLAMEMTSRPGERRFYAELLTLLGAPQRPRADIAQMEQAALRIMEAIGVQVLVIDEVHNGSSWPNWPERSVGAGERDMRPWQQGDLGEKIVRNGDAMARP